MENKIKAYYRILPDNTIWVTEFDGTGRDLAQWKSNYDHPENMSKANKFGTLWNVTTKEHTTYNNKKEWAKNVRTIYDIDTTIFKAESWLSGMFHQGKLSDIDLYEP